MPNKILQTTLGNCLEVGVHPIFGVAGGYRFVNNATSQISINK